MRKMPVKWWVFVVFILLACDIERFAMSREELQTPERSFAQEFMPYSNLRGLDLSNRNFRGATLYRGDMTIREVTRPATFDVTARLDGNTFSGNATSYLLMRDFGFEPPSIMGMLEVTDGVTVTLNFVAEETQAQ